MKNETKRKMKIKEIHAGIKVTKNYDSYQASLTADLETGEDPEKVGAELMEKALAIVNKKIGAKLDKKSFGKIKRMNNETEVGAAWLDKKFKDKLSVKDSTTGKWRNVRIVDLEKTGEGYRQKTSEGVFIFRKLLERERTNNKMPIYRIYKIGGLENEK